MNSVFKYLKKFYGRMAFGLTVKILATVSELFIPYIMSYVLKTVIEKSVPDIIFWGVLMIICAAIAAWLNICANRMAADVSRKFAENLRRDLFGKTLRLSAAQTDRFTIPSLESRITTDTYHVHGFINGMQRMGVRAPILIIGGISITLFMDAQLSLVMMAILPFLFAAVLIIRRRGIPLYEKVQKSIDSMIKVVREDIQGIRVIKALSKTDYECRRYDEVNKNLVNRELFAGISMGTVNPIMTTFVNMGSVAVISMSALRVAGKVSDPEIVIAFMQYFTQISMALMAVTRMFMMYTKSSASAKRIEEVLNCEEDIKLYGKEEYPDKNTDAHIAFDNVNFSYKGKKNNVEGINFELKKGESLGIIGATGSGKSTIIKLLLRFYDVSDGNIYINGRNIKTIPKNEFCEMFGCAMQYDFLYADTIEENIKFGREISKEDVIKAAEIAQAHSFISEIPGGYNHKLSSHGTNISGGQKQRILISRAIAGKPDILILDDSSSALDYKTDAALRAALKENMSGITKVTVAQRVSTIKDCDLILVLDNGKIIGAGKHDALLENCIEYKEIADSQMGGALID